MQQNPSSKLIPLPPQTLNYKRSFKSWIVQHHLTDAVFCPTKTFYPYNLDIKDAGWGCAWRCIQMILTQQDLPFSQLFLNYGSKQSLMHIYQQLYPKNLSQLQLLMDDNTWAPFDNSSYWAEPFVAHLVASQFGVKSQLLLVNSYPASAHAPQQVFDRTLSFEEFALKLQKHFDERKGLVMLDDATYALVLFGCQVKNGELELLVGDPHIKSNRTEKDTGIYRVLLDAKGEQKANTLSEGEMENMMFPSYRAVTFNKKPWMVLFTQN